MVSLAPHLGRGGRIARQGAVAIHPVWARRSPLAQGSPSRSAAPMPSRLDLWSLMRQRGARFSHGLTIALTIELTTTLTETC